MKSNASYLALSSAVRMLLETARHTATRVTLVDKGNQILHSTSKSGVPGARYLTISIA